MFVLCDIMFMYRGVGVSRFRFFIEIDRNYVMVSSIEVKERIDDHPPGRCAKLRTHATQIMHIVADAAS